MKAAIHSMPTDWDQYAQPFTAVMPSPMVRLNQEVASLMFGHVVDFGSGGGKIIPYALTQVAVDSYTGIDASPAMIDNARRIADHYDSRRATLINARIEEVTGGRWDSAVSVNSYYAWEDQHGVLRHIYASLPEGARFVLATINDQIDMPRLLKEAEKELIAHPYWEAFRDHNLEIMDNMAGRLDDTHTLITCLADSGFTIERAHNDHYLGGLSLIISRRGPS